MKLTNKLQLDAHTGTAIVRVSWQADGMGEDPPGYVIASVTGAIERTVPDALSAYEGLHAGRHVFGIAAQVVHAVLDDRESHCLAVTPALVEEWMSREQAAQELIDLLGEDALVEALERRGYTVETDDG